MTIFLDKIGDSKECVSGGSVSLYLPQRIQTDHIEFQYDFTTNRFLRVVVTRNKDHVFTIVLLEYDDYDNKYILSAIDENLSIDTVFSKLQEYLAL